MAKFQRSRRVLLAALLGAALTGCNDDDSLLRAFDGPSDVAVLPGGEILKVPVGFVSNYRSGLITKLDLKHETFLRDQSLGSWIQSMPIATGRDRFLDQLEVYSHYQAQDESAGLPESYHITLFGSDSSRNLLLVIPYLDTEVRYGDHCNPNPICQTDDVGGAPGCTMPRYPICAFTTEASGGTPLVLRGRDTPGTISLSPFGGAYEVTDFWLREGHSTTETWTAHYDATRESFLITGSRSGFQDNTAALNEIYYSDHNEVEFLVSGSGELEDGATFSFRVESGIEEIPLEGLIQDLRVFPEQKRLFATIQSIQSIEVEGVPTDVSIGQLLVVSLDGLDDWDEVSLTGRPYASLGAQIETYPLCSEGEGAETCSSIPMAMDLDEEGQRLFISDASDAGVVFEVDLSSEPITIRALSGFSPNLDVAFINGSTEDKVYEHLLIANLDVGTVSMYDVTSEAMVDINPYTAEVDPLRVYSPLRGIAAGRAPVFIQEYSDEGAQSTAILAAITTHDGDVIPIKAETGCIPFASIGGAGIGSYTTEPTPDLGATSNPYFSTDALTGIMGVVSTCGGVTRGETWTFVYDELEQAYRVSGSATNELREHQVGLAYENIRYTTDRGELSVLIRAGTLPTTDGDTLTMGLLSGLSPISLGASGSSGGALPGDLAIYDETFGDRNESWTAAEHRTVAIVPAPGNDVVYKLDVRQPGSVDEALMRVFK